MSNYPDNYSARDFNAWYGASGQTAFEHDALAEIERELNKRNTWDDLAALHDDDMYEIIEDHGADYDTIESEAKEMSAKISAKMDRIGKPQWLIDHQNSRPDPLKAVLTSAARQGVA